MVAPRQEGVEALADLFSGNLDSAVPVDLGVLFDCRGVETQAAVVIRSGDRGNVAVVGYRDVASLEDADTYEAVRELVIPTYPEDTKPSSLSIHVGQVWRFVGEMKEGDLVILPRKRTSQIAVGQIVGPYRYNGGSERVHTRAVKWLNAEIPRDTFQMDSLVRCSDDRMPDQAEQRRPTHSGRA